MVRPQQYAKLFEVPLGIHWAVHSALIWPIVRKCCRWMLATHKALTGCFLICLMWILPFYSDVVFEKGFCVEQVVANFEGTLWRKSE